MRARCSASFSRYSSASPAWILFAMTCRFTRVGGPSIIRSAASSNSMPSARSSVARASRDTNEIATMPAMNAREMTMPSGFSTTLSKNA